MSVVETEKELTLSARKGERESTLGLFFINALFFVWPTVLVEAYPGLWD